MPTNSSGLGTHQVVGHRVNIRRDLLPSAFETCNICLSTKYSFYTDISCYSLDLVAEAVQSVHHVVDGIFENKYFTPSLNVDLSAHIAVRNGLRNTGDTTDLCQVSKNRWKTNGRLSYPQRNFFLPE